MSEISVTSTREMTLIDDLIGDFVSRSKIADPEGLLLIGSASRNEAAVRHDMTGNPQLLSDLEFIAVVLDPRRRDDLRQAANETTKLHASPFFHVDVTTLLPSQFRRQRHRLWLWEAMAGGRIVAGHDFRPLLPAIRPKTLDLAEANEILLWQFWRLFEHFDRAILNEHRAQGGHCPSDACLEMRQAAGRAVLDIPTWALATQGDLHVGFKARHSAFVALPDVPAEVKETCDSALRIRFNNAEDADSCATLVQRALRALIWADETRRNSDSPRLTDTSLRNQVSNLRYFAQKSGLSLLPALPSLARPRARLSGRCRALAAELLTHLADSPIVPEEWDREWRSARLDAVRTVAWIAKGEER